MGKIRRTDYDIRTMAYYIQKDPMYAKLLSILTEMRNDRRCRGIPTPVEILNEASYLLDKTRAEHHDTSYIETTLPENIHPLLRAVACMIYCIMDLQVVAYVVADKTLQKDQIYFPKFRSLVADFNNAVYNIQDNTRKTQLEDENQELRENLTSAEQALADKEHDVARLRQELDEKNSLLQAYQDKEEEISLDDVLTFDNVLQYIESRQLLSQCSQLIGMLKDVMLGNPSLMTQEQYQKVMTMEQKMLQKGDTVPTTINYNFGSKIIQGVFENPEVNKLLNSPEMPIGKTPEQIVTEMLQLYLNNGKQ